MATKREQELRKEVDRLKKELEENRKLMQQALVKIAQIEAAQGTKAGIPNRKSTNAGLIPQKPAQGS